MKIMKKSEVKRLFSQEKGNIEPSPTPYDFRNRALASERQVISPAL